MKEVDFYSRGGDPKEYEELAKTLEGVKVIRIDNSLTELITALPYTVRRIYCYEFWQQIDNLEETVKRFPYLINADGSVPVEVANNTSLKVICPKMIETEEKFNLRPRKIMINFENVHQLNKHQSCLRKWNMLKLLQSMNLILIFSLVK